MAAPYCEFGKKKHLFTIEEPEGIYFFRSDMKIECISLDSGEGRFAAKPGKYRLYVVFKQKLQNGQYAKVVTLSVEFKVIDTTPIGIFKDRGKTNYLIDLNRSRNPAQEPIKLHLSGPRNQPVKLELCYTRDENDNPCTIRDPKTAGSFNKREIKLSGAGKGDGVIYTPGPNARSSQVVAAAHFGKIPKKLKSTIL